MAKYIALIVGDTTPFTDPAAAERSMQEHTRFSDDHRDALRGGEALKPPVTVVRADKNGGFVVTDGPFSETKEVLGGYYVFEAADHPAAVEIAKQVPVVGGWIELREIMEFD